MHLGVIIYFMGGRLFDRLEFYVPLARRNEILLAGLRQRVGVLVCRPKLI